MVSTSGISLDRITNNTVYLGGSEKNVVLIGKLMIHQQIYLISCQQQTYGDRRGGFMPLTNRVGRLLWLAGEILYIFVAANGWLCKPLTNMGHWSLVTLFTVSTF